MRPLKTVMVEKVVAEDIVCNKCGKSCKRNVDYEFAHMQVIWGYDSKNKDLDCHDWDLCEDCYDEIVATFKHPPEVTEVWGDNPPPVVVEPERLSCCKSGGCCNEPPLGNDDYEGGIHGFTSGT